MTKNTLFHFMCIIGSLITHKGIKKSQQEGSQARLLCYEVIITMQIWYTSMLFLKLYYVKIHICVLQCATLCRYELQ